MSDSDDIEMPFAVRCSICVPPDARVYVFDELGSPAPWRAHGFEAAASITFDMPLPGTRIIVSIAPHEVWLFHTAADDVGGHALGEILPIFATMQMFEWCDNWNVPKRVRYALASILN